MDQSRCTLPITNFDSPGYPSQNEGISVRSSRFQVMNVSLTPELEQFVHSQVKTGRYLSASEVVCEALRLLEERDRLREIRIETLRQEIVLGIEQSDRPNPFKNLKIQQT